MMQNVDVAPKSLQPYVEHVGDEALDELRSLAAPLRGARVAHINATAYGGGVSELLRSIIPLYRSFGVEAEWFAIPGRSEFFEVTKGFHNALQGAEYDLTESRQDTWVGHNVRLARHVPEGFDYIVVHDPQPAGLRQLHGRGDAKWVWRCHIDTSQPNPEVFSFLQPFIQEYDALIFTMDQFVPDALRDGQRIAIMPPGIDPLSPKNMALPSNVSSQIMAWSGVKLDQDLLTQVSRFDPWKDPMGVIEVYRRVRKEAPGTQLALVGQMALDDPEGWDIYNQVAKEASGDPDIHVLTNITGVGNMEVNAFQQHSTVVLQKSIREGFGLIVSETLWKGTALVAGRVGGIPMQMPKENDKYLVETNDEYVERILELLGDPRTRQEVGTRGRAHVRDRFLITRLLADELRLLGSLD